MVYKNIKGLTLVEVLVSVVITIIVMIYGMTLFISAWRLEVDSEEYSKVLQYISNTIEGYKRYSNPLEIKDGKNQNGSKINGVYKSITLDNIKLPSGKLLQQTVIFHNAENDIVPMSVVAIWPVGTVGENQKIERIVVNTHLGINENIDINK